MRHVVFTCAVDDTYVVPLAAPHTVTTSTESLLRPGNGDAEGVGGGVPDAEGEVPVDSVAVLVCVVVRVAEPLPVGLLDGVPNGVAVPVGVTVRVPLGDGVLDGVIEDVGVMEGAAV